MASAPPAPAVTDPAAIPGAQQLLATGTATLTLDQAALANPAFGVQALGALVPPGPQVFGTTGASGLSIAPAAMGFGDEWLADYICSPYTPPIPAAACGGSHVGRAFGTLARNRSLGFARFILPYDAVATFDPVSGGCQYVAPVEAFGTGGPVVPWWQLLGDFLIAARATGLTPTIAIGPAALPSDPLVPDMGYAPDRDAYACGVQGLLGWTSEIGLPVNEWEAWNEPDVGQNQVPALSEPQNAANAATMLVALELSSSALQRSGDTFAAGTFSAWTHHQAFIEEYLAVLGSYGLYPQVWSFHDYGDVQQSSTCAAVGAPGCATSEIDQFLATIDRFYEAAGRQEPTVWITETGPLFGHGGPLAPGRGAAALLAQASAAEDVLALGSHSIQVTRVYPYNMQTVARVGFDSALIDSDGSSPQDGGSTAIGASVSVWRPSYCVLALGYTPVQASTSSRCQDPGGPNP